MQEHHLECDHIGKEKYDKVAFASTVPVVISSLLLLQYSTQYSSITITNASLSALNYSLRLLISSLSKPYVCPVCDYRKAMV